MDITVIEMTTVITTMLLWLSIVDIAVLVNIACWYCVAWLAREIRRMRR